MFFCAKLFVQLVRYVGCLLYTQSLLVEHLQRLLAMLVSVGLVRVQFLVHVVDGSPQLDGIVPIEGEQGHGLVR